MQKLISDIFGDKANDVDHLRSVCEEYPFFGLAQLALLKQMDKSDPDYNKQLQKTALYFNEPFLLKYHLEYDLADHVQDASTHDDQTNDEIVITDVSEKQIEDTIIVEEHQEVPSLPQQVHQENLSKDSLLFEPLHTTDYFASQGIRLSEEQKAEDKLGRQLKSFTEWLKTMKKVHSVKQENVPVDPAVEKLAEKSNVEEDVITESMAEVYESQGKYAKARETYQKLSLLNPAKSAYFAAKLEKIKER